MTRVEEIKKIVEGKKDVLVNLNDEIWATPELYFREEKSAAALIRVLKEQGFEVEENVDGISTAFIGTYGSGHPIIGILGEFDALPSLSQEACKNVHSPIEAGGPGHGCGHCALGAAALGAAIAAKDYMQAHGIKGTVRYYGCPAEEAGWGKMFLARDGYYDDLDACYTWHPGNCNTVQSASSLANMCAYFTFKGKTAHAAAAPHLGRSALDACEIMNVGVNYLREHVIAEGIKDIARGAALITGTTVEMDFPAGMCDYVPNDVLSGVLSDAFLAVGGPEFDDADRALAESFYKDLNDNEKEAALKRLAPNYPDPDKYRGVALIEDVAPYVKSDSYGFGSTDVGDASYACPTAQLNAACYANGTPGHSWQITAQSASSITHKAILCVAKVIALATINSLEDPEMLKKAHEEYVKVTGGKYICPVGKDAKPRI